MQALYNVGLILLQNIRCCSQSYGVNTGKIDHTSVGLWPSVIEDLIISLLSRRTLAYAGIQIYIRTFIHTYTVHTCKHMYAFKQQTYTKAYIVTRIQPVLVLFFK